MTIQEFHAKNPNYNYETYNPFTGEVSKIRKDPAPVTQKEPGIFGQGLASILGG